MIIHRTTATKIMSKAIALQDQNLLGILDQNDQIVFCHNEEDMKTLINTHHDSTWIYNQNQDAIDIMDQLNYSDGQQCIEIFQDTEGVFGLRAYRQMGKIQTPITLELSDSNQ